MINGKPFILGKIFNNRQYAINLLNGQVYINPLASFGAGNLSSANKEMTNIYRGDLNEGLSMNSSTSDLYYNNRVINFFQDIGGIPFEADSLGEVDTRFLSENVYCLSAIFFDAERKRLQHLNDKLFQFDDDNQGLAIIIYDVKKFLERVIKTLSDSMGSPYWISYGLVDYNFDKHENKVTDEFTKEKSFSYQQEFRIAINITEPEYKVRRGTDKMKYDLKNGSLLLNIGSIRDIAFTLPIDDYINLKFPNEYQWLKTSLPDMICDFYPPIKNTISYSCPLIRINEAIFISENAMYPIIRNVNSYSINQKHIKKVISLNPSDDSFFLEILNIYFSRMLDIYKSMGDKSLLEQTLTAFLNYMFLLNIFSCAGLLLKKENETFQALYQDIHLHDLSLTDEFNYEMLPKKAMQPKPTDFAVLISLSNQSRFEEYEYEGKKYVRVEVAKDGVLPSGKSVKVGEAVWIEVCKVKFAGY